MQAITTDLLNILFNHFQAGASGFQGRVEIDYSTLGGGASALVQSKHGTEAGVTFDSTVAAGNVLVAVPWIRDSASVRVAATLAGSCPEDTSWTRHATDVYAATSGFMGFSMHAKVAPSAFAGPWYTTASCLSNASDLSLLEFSGVSNTGVAVLSQNDGTGGTIDLGTHAGMGANDVQVMAVVLFQDGNFNDPIVAPTGFTEIRDSFLTGFSQPFIWLGYKIGNGAARVTLGDPQGLQWGAASIRLPAAALTTVSLPLITASIDKSRRMAAAQADLLLNNESGAIVVGPDAPVQTNGQIRVYQWYGTTANETRTFTGLIDEIHETRDPRNVRITARDRFKLLIEQNISIDSPQGAEETGAVRTTANGVYLDMDVDAILADLLNKAGWPTAARNIFPTGYSVEEFLAEDGMSYADAIIGDEKLTGLTGYDAWADELGVFQFRPILRNQAADTDTDPVPVYSYIVGDTGANNLVSAMVLELDHSIDEYELRTRVKVRGTIATAVPAFSEAWHTSVFTRPVGVWYDPAESTHIKVLDRATKKIYRFKQSTRAKDPSGIWPLSVAANVTYPLGLSGDPADSTIFWVLNAAWRATGGATLTASIHKYRKSDGVHLASYALPNGSWSDIKVSSSFIWLTNLDDEKIYKRSKTDGSAIASYTTVYGGVNQVNPTGVAIDNTTLALFFLGKARFLLVDESDPTTVDTTNALGVTSGRVKTAGSNMYGGEIDTDTDAHLFGVSDDLGLVWKFNLTTPSEDEVAVEVVDQALEDELGFLSGTANREHDSHPADADHSFEIRRETISIADLLDNVAQATETATRKMNELSVRREVLDLGIVGHPGLQRGDLIQATDSETGIAAQYLLDTIRTHMDNERGYVGTIALLPYEAVY